MVKGPVGYIINFLQFSSFLFFLWPSQPQFELSQGSPVGVHPVHQGTSKKSPSDFPTEAGAVVQFVRAAWDLLWTKESCCMLSVSNCMLKHCMGASCITLSHVPVSASLGLVRLLKSIVDPLQCHQRLTRCQSHSPKEVSCSSTQKLLGS